jgi:hypothetical protein
MRLFAFTVVVVCVAGVAPGQTTRPVSDTPLQWAKTVSSLAGAIVAHDSQGVQTLVGGDCHVSRFFGPADQDDSQFLDAVFSTAVLGDHAYIFPTNTMAADIAADVNTSSVVSEIAKQTLDLGDKRGKPIATQWIAQALSAADGDFLGIIILWDTRTEGDDQHRLNFVLVKGQESGPAFKIERVMYGDPLQ